MKRRKTDPDPRTRMEARILTVLQRQGAISLKQLRRRVRSQRSQREIFQAALRALQAAGRLRLRGRLVLPAETGPPSQGRSRGRVQGRMDRHPEGFGFVVLPGDVPDLHVPRRFMAGAMHGDQVSVRPERGKAKVVRIIERAHTELVGRLLPSSTGWLLEPADPRICPTLHLEIPEGVETESGTLAVARIDRYPTDTRPPGGALLRILGRPDDPEALEELIVQRHGLRTEFSEDLRREARQASQRRPGPAGRKDLRGLPAFTVDPEDARDFDDALTIESLPGGWRLGIHIADVSWFVPQGAPLDEEARLRGTSVYLPRRVLPMLPEALSGDACSLKPDLDRPVLSVLVEVDREGRTGRVSMSPSLIRSRARWTYEQMEDFLEKGPAGAPDELRGALEAAPALLEALLRARRDRGGLDLDLGEPRVTRSASGEVTGVRRKDRMAAHRLIEEAMVLANTLVARRLRSEAGGIYRIHEPPDPERIELLLGQARALGHAMDLPEQPTPLQLSRALRDLPSGPLGEVLRIRVLRSLRLARYTDVSSSGHYGLGLDAYLHFTSPIRRYPDLVVHRILRWLLAGEEETPPHHGELGDLAEGCTGSERAAEKAEGDAMRIETARALAPRIGERMEGFVLEILRSGLVVRLRDGSGDGYLPADHLPGMDFRRSQDQTSVTVRGGGGVLRLADRVEVCLEEVDIPAGRILLDYVAGPLAGGFSADPSARA